MLFSCSWPAGQAAGTAGMTLVERPEPQAATNDVVVQVHASGFVPTELAWSSTWTDRLDRDRTPSIPGHELAGVVSALGYGTKGVRPHRLDSRRHPGGVRSCRGTQPRTAAGRRGLHGGRQPTTQSPHSTRPRGSRGRQSSAFVREQHAPIDARSRRSSSRPAVTSRFAGDGSKPFCALRSAAHSRSPEEPVPSQPLRHPSPIARRD